jgi:8-oxo-dGTP pyrophosphatase MutT (NUDIX family)
VRPDGDGWLHCALGHRHWGLFGAAGLLAHRGDGASREILLQHRAEWSHHGGTWGLLGGARHHEESAVDAALREAAEEAGLRASDVRVQARSDDDHGGWSYRTVVAVARTDLAPFVLNGESAEVAWWPVDRLPEPLHPGFAAAWPVLQTALEPIRVVVDMANVMGSRPDGWWRDRAAAAGRLIAGINALAVRGVADGAFPSDLHRPGLRHWWPEFTLALEGAAREAAASAVLAPGVALSLAPGHGDDTIVSEAARWHGQRVLVVTADHELRGRCESVGATTVGPRWLLDLTAP